MQRHLGVGAGAGAPLLEYGLHCEAVARIGTRDLDDPTEAALAEHLVHLVKLRVRARARARARVRVRVRARARARVRVRVRVRVRLTLTC